MKMPPKHKTVGEDVMGGRFYKKEFQGLQGNLFEAELLLETVILAVATMSESDSG
jgi:hypothetical protein